MQLKTILKSGIRGLKKPFMLLSLVCFLMVGANAQTTLTTNFTVNNGNGFVTFNFINNNAFAVMITDIGSVVNLTQGDADVSAWYKPGAINGAPGAISVANGWNSFGSGTVSSVGTGAIQPFLSCLSLVIPANSTYGICVNAFSAGTTTGALAYSTIAAGTYNFPGGGCILRTGTNIGYAGAGVPNAPANTPRGFVGSVTFTNATACSGTPGSLGATSSTIPAVCPSEVFKLSVANCLGIAGLTYQWQSSATGTAGSFLPIVGATGRTLTTSQTTAKYYQLVATCTASGLSSSSTALLVPMSTICYCAASSTDGTFESIVNVKFNTINNPSAGTSGYQNFTNVSTTLEQYATYPITIDITDGFGGTSGYATDQVVVFIDYNHNGSFTDPGETVYTSAIGPGSYSGSITVPSTTVLGPTRMRIRLHDTGGLSPNPTSCGTSDYGEVEDYTVNLAACVPITGLTQPSNVSLICGNNATFSLGGTGSFLTYQWQQQVNSSAPWTTVTNGGGFSGATTNTLTITQAPITMNGYRYRVVYTGTCTPTNFSTPVTLTVTPVVAVVNPSSATICTGGIQQLSITTIPAPVVAEFPSGPLNIVIPDGVVTGINNTIAVSGIPAGASILDVSIKVNVAHTYVADLELVIKGPNGQILNLSNLIGGGNNPGVNFTNTIFSSNGTAALNTGVSPGYTGIFKPDAAGAVAAFGIPGGPTGFLPTLPGGNVSGVSTILNGNWTIAMYDAGPPDQGTLLNWSVIITYGAPGSGTWTGPAGTIFTNAAATVPYTGTVVNTVYVKPTAVGVNNYTATVVTPTCTSAAVTIPVTVNSPATGTPAVASLSTCAGTNAVFSVTGITGGTGLTYQWQVSTLAVPAFTNIAGATSSTYTVASPTAATNGNQYRVIVSSAGCAAALTSTPGTLTVNPVPVVTISAAPVVNIYPGLTSTLTAAVSSATAPLSYQWYLNGSPVAGATSNTYVVGVDQEGSYSVSVSDANGCVSSAGASTPGSIAIGDSAGVTTLFIYPSPNSGRFQVRYYNDINNGGTAPAIVNVFDSKGARVFTRQYSLGAGYNAMNVDLSTHGKGLYRVELLDLNGNRIKTGSVLVF